MRQILLRTPNLDGSRASVWISCLRKLMLIVVCVALIPLRPGVRTTPTALAVFVSNHKIASGATAPATYQFPDLPLQYAVDVETWWTTHPFNPASPNYIPIGSIEDIQPVLDVKTQYGGNIQAAIDALPSTGGTLYFDTGEYSNGTGYNTGAFELVGKNNVHFVGPADHSAIIKGGVALALGCPAARDYGNFSALVVHGSGPDGDNARACATTNALKGIYFKNLTFDGNNQVWGSMDLRAVNGVVFDSIVFKNYVQASAGAVLWANHTGSINANGEINNIWFRGSTFAGPNIWAIYMDGCHFCGVTESNINYNFRDGGLLYMVNNDDTADLNGNGQIDYLTQEDRISNHVVSAYNTFGSAGPQNTIGLAQTFGGSNILVTKNQDLLGARKFVRYYGECQIAGSNQLTMYGPMHYIYNGFRTVANTAKDTSLFVDMDGSNYNCTSNSTMEIGKYQVRDNLVSSTNLTGFVQERSGTIDEPKIICNNIVNGNPYPDSECSFTPALHLHVYLPQITFLIQP